MYLRVASSNWKVCTLCRVTGSALFISMPGGSGLSQFSQSINQEIINVSHYNRSVVFILITPNELVSRG